VGHRWVICGSGCGDFPVERPEKRKRRCDVGRRKDACLDGEERRTVETVIAVTDADNQQMAICFAEQQVTFMA